MHGKESEPLAGRDWSGRRGFARGPDYGIVKLEPMVIIRLRRCRSQKTRCLRVCQAGVHPTLLKESRWLCVRLTEENHRRVRREWPGVPFVTWGDELTIRQEIQGQRPVMSACPVWIKTQIFNSMESSWTNGLKTRAVARTGTARLCRLC